MGDLSSSLGAAAGLLIFAVILVIGFYIVIGTFLNKFNKLVYGKKTARAWIPILNIFLLGKLTFNKAVGWVLVICSFLTCTFTTTVNGVETTAGILPESIRSTASNIYSTAVFIIFIYAIVKYKKLKKENNGTATEQVQPQAVQNNEQQNVQPQQQQELTSNVGATLNPEPVVTSLNPTVNVPVTPIPVIQTTITETPVVQTPTVETPIVQEPVVQTPVVETPIVQEPVVQTPVIETPIVQEPVVQTPAVETPIVQEPVVETPAVEIPTVQEPQTTNIV